MLISIDSGVDVQHVNEKDASIALEKNIITIGTPEYREKIHKKLRDRAFAIHSSTEDAQHHADVSIGASNRSQRPLTSNNYTYLTADVCDMIAETQTSLQSWKISDLPIEPGMSGVILFEKPKYQVSTREFRNGQILPFTTNVLGLLWTYYADGKIEDTYGNMHPNVLWVGLLVDYSQNSEKSTKYGYGTNEFAYAIHPDESLTPIWMHSDRDAHDEAIMDYFAATMMLMQQHEIIAEPSIYEPTVKRGKRRDPVHIPTGDNTLEPMKISTVSLSETVRAAYAANSTDTGTGQEPTKSWWVKGHWRRQPHGPGKTLRKLIYIHPHISGNINAPLDDRKTITKVIP